MVIELENQLAVLKSEVVMLRYQKREYTLNDRQTRQLAEGERMFTRGIGWLRCCGLEYEANRLENHQAGKNTVKKGGGLNQYTGTSRI